VPAKNKSREETHVFLGPRTHPSLTVALAALGLFLLVGGAADQLEQLVV
jgi:hypothetical protein